MTRFERVAEKVLDFAYWCLGVAFFGVGVLEDLGPLPVFGLGVVAGGLVCLP